MREATPSSMSSGVAPRKLTLTLIESGSIGGNTSYFTPVNIVISPAINMPTINKLAATEFLANHSII